MGSQCGEGEALNGLPAALAACVATKLVIYAHTKEWDLAGVTVDVDYDHRSTPRIFQVDVRLTGELSDRQLMRLEKVAAPARFAARSKAESSSWS